MIKREHIKQAIDAISKRDTSIGYALNEMLNRGVIDIPKNEEEREDTDPYFYFDGQKVRVNRILFFNEGTVPIEQGLVLRYGELAKKQDLLERESSPDYREISYEIRRAGLRLLVDHEVDLALSRLKGPRPGSSLEVEKEGGYIPGDLISFLEELRNGEPEKTLALKSPESQAMYGGMVSGDRAALFMPFPVTLESLMQVADLSLEFFHVRFVLDCLIRNAEKNIFACVVSRRIVGLVYIVPRYQLFGKDLEIKFLATQQGKEDEPVLFSPGPLKGAGTFLIGGVWLLARDRWPGVKRILLDAEVAARGFYASLGFNSVGPTGYILKRPKGFLLKSILVMTHHNPNLGQNVANDIQDAIRKQIEALRLRRRCGLHLSERRYAMEALRECFRPEAHPEFGWTAVRGLKKYGKDIPESTELLDWALKIRSDECKVKVNHGTHTHNQE